MAKQNEAKIRFTAETGEFNDAIKKSNEEMGRLRNEMKLNEAQIKAAGTSVAGLEAKHQNLSEQLAASENKTQALSQKVNKAAEIFGENSVEVKKLRSQLITAQTAEQNLRKALNVCNSELEKQKKAEKEAESVTGRLTKTIEEQQAELSELKKEYAETVLQYGKNSKEAKELAKEIDSLSSDLKKSRDAMNDAKNAADKLDNSLEDAGDAAEEASDGFTVLKGAMADLVADGISGVVDGFKEIAKQAVEMTVGVDQATNNFIAKTGESADKAAEFEEAITSIYNSNLGESFEDISDAMATIKTTMGDIGTAELEDLTTQALVLRDTFDLDVNESIRAVNSMMDQFGITADEAYNLIAQGAQSGLNQNGDLLDVVNEYSMQFKNAGYSAEDMFNMLANGVDAGTWSVDKLGDAVKEFNIRASDGTVGDAIKENAEAFGLSEQEASALAKQVQDGNVQAYDQLANKLKSIDDDTQRYQLGVAMFGTMWEDLGEDAVFALLKTEGEITKTSGALDQINQVKYDDLGSALEGIGRNLQTSVAAPINENVMPALNEFIQGVDWQSVGETIGEVFGVITQAVIGVANGIKEATQWMNEHRGVVIAVASVIGVLATAITAYNVVQGIKSAMDAAQVTTVWALVAAHLAQAAAAMAAMAPYILIVAAIAAVIAIIVLCVKHWDSIVEAVKKCWEKVKATLAQWGNWINENVIQPVVNFFKNLWNNIVNIFKSVIDWVKTNWKSILLFIINPFAGAFQYLYDNFEGFRNFVDNIISAVKNFFVNLWNSIKNGAISAWNGIKSAWSSVKSWFSGTIIQPVKNFFSNMWNSIKNAGANAWAGVKSVWSSVTGFFRNIIQKVKSTFTKVKDFILSPFKKAIEAVKGLFNKLKLSFPNIKMPHFKVSPTGWKIGDLLEGSIPKLSIDWYKDGGIFTKPTIFGTPYGLKGVGEAGAEAVLPIDRLEGYMANAIEKTQNVVNLQSLADAIEELASRPIELSVNGRTFMQATAGDGDAVNGLRNTFKNRGLVLD